ncbi:MAG: GNAT family N-acetyltransferase [Clostridia bacterium]|nr:GNAT family N-acetyltransferase [Clostridia bacterium]
MLQFTRLGKDVLKIKEYIDGAEISFCDISVGMKYMWRDYYVVDYAIVNDTLIMKETAPDYKDVFYFPFGKDVLGALNLIEEYCKANNIPLFFGCIDNEKASFLAQRYKEVIIENDRAWSDYIYDAEKFKTYSGKKLGGQRNHVNKFKKLYPDYTFNVIKETDLDMVKEFLTEYEHSKVLSKGARDEYEKVLDYIENMFWLGQVGGFLEIDGKIVALSVGEVVGNTLIVHIEKALTEYDGVYPTMANEFAKAFAVIGVKYINREEDCGETGLRISKLQYQPIEIKEKNLVVVKTLFDKISTPVLIKTECLTITDVSKADANDYARLYLDDQLNKWWGYDYREDLNGNEPTPEHFYNFQQKMKDVKEEYALAVKKDGKMIGELVLHNFDYNGGVEMGFRFFKDCQGKGYASESANALKEYCFDILGADTVKSRCFKENLPSARLIARLGLNKTHENDTHYFFALDKNN